MARADEAFITGAMDGAHGATILSRVYKRQRSNFARPCAEIPGPMAMVVKAAGHLYPAVPMLPAAPPGGRACWAASRHPPAAVAAPVRLAVAWRVVVSSVSPHHLLQDRVFSHPSTRPLLGLLRRTHPPGAADWPCHPLLPVAAPLPCPTLLVPTHRPQHPVAPRAAAGVGCRPLGGFQLCRRALRRGWGCL